MEATPIAPDNDSARHAVNERGSQGQILCVIGAVFSLLMTLFTGTPSEAVPIDDGFVFISTSHNGRIAPVGSSTSIDFLMSGLGDHRPPSLSAFNLLLRWDSKRFDFNGVSFGPFLGDPGLGKATTNVTVLGISPLDSVGFAWATFEERSLLPPGLLIKTQPERFIIASAAFDVLAVSRTVGERIGGEIGFGFAPPESGIKNYVVDEHGRPLSNVIFTSESDPTLPPAPVPEPTTLLLFGTTAAGLGLARWRQRRRKQQP